VPVESSAKIKGLLPVLSVTTDTLFLYYLLKKGERTEHFNYSKSAGELPVFKDLGDKWKSAINVMYLRAVEYDRPLRLDFLANDKDRDAANRIAALIWHISKQNRTYAYPSVLIEADARAKLKEQDLMVFQSALADKLGRNPSLFDLRREQRPF